MSRSKPKLSRFEQGVQACRQIFWQVNQDEINSNMVDEDDDKFKIGSGSKTKDDKPLYRGGEQQSSDEDEGSSSSSSTQQQINAGLRSPRWFERIERLTQENRKRSIQNQNLLQRVDFRTVWIARILIGLLIAILISVVTQAFI